MVKAEKQVKIIIDGEDVLRLRSVCKLAITSCSHDDIHFDEDIKWFIKTILALT